MRAAERALPGRPGAASGHVDAARQVAVDNLAEARRFVAALTPPALEGTTLAGALERLCTTSARHRLTARFHLVGDPVSLPTAHEVALLRIAQSTVANTLRHAQAATAEITLSHLGDRIVLHVADDGRGFDPEDLPAPDIDGGGFGLAAMRARMAALGAPWPSHPRPAGAPP
ncbi:ATP-binding protein [Micromonospora sp. BRA006-A]|nr:ATP-binding protein [Micromonospora sp. BRA006-A]